MGKEGKLHEVNAVLFLTDAFLQELIKMYIADVAKVVAEQMKRQAEQMERRADRQAEQMERQADRQAEQMEALRADIRKVAGVRWCRPLHPLLKVMQCCYAVY